MQVSDVVKELRKSIIFVLDKARELYIEDHAEEIKELEEYRQFCDFMSQLIEDIKKGKF